MRLPQIYDFDTALDMQGAVSDKSQCTRHTGHMAGAATKFCADIAIRRYSLASRPWIPFHMDHAAVTVNIAISDDKAHGGGRLIVVHDNQIQVVSRAEGDATVHNSRLLHAVTSMLGGVRYSLVLFFKKVPLFI